MPKFMYVVKSGIIKERQRYLCKECKYYFTVNKLGKKLTIIMLPRHCSYIWRAKVIGKLSAL